MATKEQLKGGLSSLFGETPTEETASAAEISAQETASAMAVEPTTQKDEEDLINSVEDEALREALKRKRMDGRGRPRKNTDATGKRTDGYSRTSLILNDEKVAKIKEIAFRETLTMKEIFELGLDMIIERYEQKHGKVTPHPESYKGDINSVFNK